MFVISVIPISRGILVDELSYFTADIVPVGALVSVPVRGRRVSALVVSCRDVREEKSSLKSADFMLKKLEHIDAKRGFSRAFLAAAERVAEHDGVTVGAVLSAVFPISLLAASSDNVPDTVPKPETFSDCFIVQAEDEDRSTIYRSLIREMFAKGSSVFLALPSIQDIEHIYESMERGIKEYTFVLHGGLSKGELKKRWQALAANPHPVLVIGTAYFLGVPRSDIAAIIVDKESSSAYRIQGRPFTDLRRFAEEFANASGARLIFGDIMLRVETLYRASRGELEALTRPKTRLISTAEHTVVDMKETGEQPATGRWAIYSPTLVDAIEENKTQGMQSFLLGIRKGYAPMTVCGDCGQVATCERCSAPVVLYKRKLPVASCQLPENTDAHTPTPTLPPSGGGGNADTPPDRTSSNLFLCHRCGHERSPEYTCPNCRGWRLVSLGFGIDQATESLKGRFPKLPIFHIDRDATPTHKEARKVAEAFYATPGAVMIGTEMAIPYLTKPLGTVGVLSVNSLLTIPDFRMGEKVFRLLLALRGKAARRFIVQTRDAKQPLFKLAATGNIGEFVETELETRKALNYPPFATLLKLTHEGTKEAGEKAMKEIERIFAPFTPVTFPSFIARVKGKYRMNALMKIPREKWPDKDVLALLRSLPADIEVRVDPESVI